MKPTKKRKCEICRTPFVQYQSFVTWCSTDCGYKVSQKRIAKSAKLVASAERVEIKARKEATKTLNDWIADTQTIFNRFIRIRDEINNQPCICCAKYPKQTWLHGGEWDCGHFRSRGSAGHLRFDENNAHRQLKQCNRHGAGRHSDYRIGLIARIGLEAVEALESNQTIRKWSIDDLKAIQATYKAKIKAIQGKS